MSDEIKTRTSLINRKSYLDIISDIKSSKHRAKVLLIFMEDCEYKTPSEISKVSGIGISHTCKILKDLKKHNLIICINEEDRKNKKHLLTDLGKRIGDYISNQ